MKRYKDKKMDGLWMGKYNDGHTEGKDMGGAVFKMKNWVDVSMVLVEKVQR